jgi:hypothetical protein
MTVRIGFETAAIIIDELAPGQNNSQVKGEAATTPLSAGHATLAYFNRFSRFFMV